MIENLYPFAIALLIGLLIGLERERSHPEGFKAIGVRTFILFALLGALGAYIHQPLLTATLSFFAFGAILLGYYFATQKQKQTDIGLTTEMTAAAVFCLGYMVFLVPLIAVALASMILLILVERQRIHELAREKLQPKEIEAAVVLLLFAAGILPFLPNHAVDPWHLFNPYYFGFLITIISAIQFGGYVAIRVFGHRFGMILSGFFGGLVSSTVVFSLLPKFYRESPQLLRSIMAVALFAIVAMLSELIVILGFASSPLLLTLIWPMLLMIVVGGMSGLILIEYQNFEQGQLNEFDNPLDLKLILRLSVFIIMILMLVTLAQRYVGSNATLLIAFLTGLFDIHSITIATASLYTIGKLQLVEASRILIVAIFATFVSKLFLLWSLGRNRFAGFMSLFIVLMLVGGGVGILFHPSF